MGLNLFDTGLSIFADTIAGVVFSNDGTKTTLLGTAGDYIRIGDAGTTAHSLDSEDDLMVTGELEVKGAVFMDSNVTMVANKWFSFDGGASLLTVETADANAICWQLSMADGANQVPVFALMADAAFNSNLGFFDAVTEPALAVLNLAGDAYVSLDAGDINGTENGLYYKPAADEDVTLLSLSVTGTPSIIWDESENAFGFSHNVAVVGVQLDEALSSDHTYSGEICNGVAGYGAAFGELVYLDDTDDKWEKAQANTEATTGGNYLLGIVISTTITENNTGKILLKGYVRDVSAFEFGSAGKPLYLSAATAGLVTATAPTGTTGFIVRRVGSAGDDADTIFFNPDGTYVELA